ncbi:phage tail assembly protein [Pseudomonas sp. M30-35]|uniref:phage tail assembly protein n=1 Tax=Pseudomonas sp. M30-35 TaxID=1981174 RepID=UPI000B3C4D37|nr:phage tail assembly protein [Pseudomonas sp. M30-35]ARU88280.1 phage tail protein [Pseudomonas sp. M30-35]
MSKPEYSAPIELVNVITRGTQKTKSITLRKPGSGELRGLRLSDLLQGDVNAVIRVVPRISEPSLTEQEVSAMDVYNLTECADAIAVFLQVKGTPAKADSPEA